MVGHGREIGGHWTLTGVRWVVRLGVLRHPGHHASHLGRHATANGSLLAQLRHQDCALLAREVVDLPG